MSSFASTKSDLLMQILFSLQVFRISIGIQDERERKRKRESFLSEIFIFSSFMPFSDEKIYQKKVGIFFSISYEWWVKKFCFKKRKKLVDWMLGNRIFCSFDDNFLSFFTFIIINICIFLFIYSSSSNHRPLYNYALKFTHFPLLFIGLYNRRLIKMKAICELFILSKNSLDSDARFIHLKNASKHPRY